VYLYTRAFHQRHSNQISPPPTQSPGRRPEPANDLEPLFRRTGYDIIQPRTTRRFGIASLEYVKPQLVRHRRTSAIRFEFWPFVYREFTITISPFYTGERCPVPATLIDRYRYIARFSSSTMNEKVLRTYTPFGPCFYSGSIHPIRHRRTETEIPLSRNTVRLPWKRYSRHFGQKVNERARVYYDVPLTKRWNYYVFELRTRTIFIYLLFFIVDKGWSYTRRCRTVYMYI